MILRRYITYQVATTTALVLGFLVVMLLGGRLIRYFGIAAEGGLDVSVLFTLIGYNLPYFLELILPLSFFIGLMLTFGRMYGDNEMAVLIGSGVSRGTLSRLLLPLLVVLFVGHGVLTLFGKPWGVASATNIWQEQAVIKAFDMVRPKTFISSGDYHLYVGQISADKRFLKDVIIVQIGNEKKADHSDSQNRQSELASKIADAQKDTLIFAKSATQVKDMQGLVLDLIDGQRYELDPKSRQYSQVGFRRYRVSLQADTKTQNKQMKIEGVPTMQLFGRLASSSENNPNAVRAELGYRFSLPFVMILALMLATPLATTRPRQGRWLRLIPAVFVFITNVLILISLKETITKGKIGVWIYPASVVILFVFAMYLNYHERIVSHLRLTDKTQGKV